MCGHNGPPRRTMGLNMMGHDGEKWGTVPSLILICDKWPTGIGRRSVELLGTSTSLCRSKVCSLSPHCPPTVGAVCAVSAVLGRERDTSSLRTYWSESATSSRCVSRPASRHGGWNSLFHVA